MCVLKAQRLANYLGADGIRHLIEETGARIILPKDVTGPSSIKVTASNSESLKAAVQRLTAVLDGRDEPLPGWMTHNMRLPSVNSPNLIGPAYNSSY